MNKEYAHILEKLQKIENLLALHISKHQMIAVEETLGFVNSPPHSHVEDDSIFRPEDELWEHKKRSYE